MELRFFIFVQQSVQFLLANNEWEKYKKVDLHNTVSFLCQLRTELI